jgi:hypothetical protein
MGELDIDSVLAPVELGERPARSGKWIWLGAAAAIVALIVGAVALVREPSNGSISPAPPETTVPITVPPTIAVEEPAVTTTAAAEPAVTVADVQAAVTERLSTLQGVRATATVHTRQTALDGSTVPTAQETTSVNEITLMADGSLWLQGDLARWSSYDASTGVSRAAFITADGATQYQEIVGWTDNTTPLLIALRVNPVMRFDSVQDSTVEEVVSRLGRPAWRLRNSLEYGAPDDLSAFSQQEIFTIDKESGLIVEYRQVVNNGVEDVTEMSLTDLQLDATLPAEFPGSFPDGAVVDHSGNPAGFRVVAPEEASAQFGSPVFLPAAADSTVRIVMSTNEGLWGQNSLPVTSAQLTIELRTGFVINSVLIMKTTAQPGTEVTDPTAVVVDGLICFSTDGVTCSDASLGSVITEGALAGAPSVAQSSSVSASVGAVQYVVIAGSSDEALAIANSFS